MEKLNKSPSLFLRSRSPLSVSFNTLSSGVTQKEPVECISINGVRKAITDFVEHLLSSIDQMESRIKGLLFFSFLDCNVNAAKILTLDNAIAYICSIDITRPRKGLQTCRFI